jgi:hypothetical protein
VTIYDFFDHHEFLFFISVLSAASCLSYALDCVKVLLRGYPPIKVDTKPIDQSIDSTM